MQLPQLIPRLVTETRPNSNWTLTNWFSLRRANSIPDPYGRRQRQIRIKEIMAEVEVREAALKLCPWASSEDGQWKGVTGQLQKLATRIVSREPIKFNFSPSTDYLGAIEGLGADISKITIAGVTDPDQTTNGETDTEKTEGDDKQPVVLTTSQSLAPTNHTNELVASDSTPFYHSHTLTLPTKPAPQSANGGLVLSTVSRSEIRLNCCSQTVHSVKSTKAESSPMQDFHALNNTVNSKGQTVFTEKKDGKYYIWATHHSTTANDPEKYWFYVVRNTYVGPDGHLTAVIFAELTPRSGWVYDPDMHYKGHFYLAKIKPMAEKKALDHATHLNPPRANRNIFIPKRKACLPMLEIHSGEPFVFYKNKQLDYYLSWVDWENQKLWSMCHVTPLHSPQWNASQTRPIPILFNGGFVST